MKKKVTAIIYAASIFFILMGVGTILKGDIENTKEALIMAAFLLFFVSIMLVVKGLKFCKVISNNSTG